MILLIISHQSHFVNYNFSTKYNDTILKTPIEIYFENIASIVHLVKPMKEKLDIEELIKEQHYQDADKVFIDVLADEMQIEEPIEELLEML